MSPSLSQEINSFLFLIVESLTLSFKGKAEGEGSVCGVSWWLSCATGG